MRNRTLSYALLALQALGLTHLWSPHTGDAHEVYDRRALLEEHHGERPHVCADAARFQAPETCATFAAARTPCAIARAIDALESPQPDLDATMASRPAARGLEVLRVAPKTSPPA